MSEEKTLEDVIGFLMSVAEFDLEKTKRVPIPGGAMTVVSENYQYMSEIIDWIEAKFSEPKLNENQEIVLEWLKKEYAESNLFPIEIAWLLFESVDSGYFEPEEERAFENLNKSQEAQVLQEFASWVEQEVE